eukprot:80298_1
MMSNLEVSKRANQQIKSIVFGYIREQESYLLYNCNIPLLISYTCLSFYYVPEFISKARTDYFEISDDKMTIKNIRGHCSVDKHAIFCNQWITSTLNIIAKWTFLIQNRAGNLYFGLASNDEYLNNDFCRPSNEPCYQIANHGGKYAHDIPFNFGNNKLKQFGNSDTVVFYLDLISNEQYGIWSFQINGKDKIVIFNDVRKGDYIQYKMAFQITGKDGCVVLKGYHESYK